MSTDSQSSTQTTWDKRFAFFDAHGAPKNPAFREALKKLEFFDRAKIMMSFWAVMFGPFYLLYLGLWKKAISYYAAFFLLVFVLSVLGIPEVIFKGMGTVSAMFAGMFTNYAYYLKKVKNQDGWNPFEGLF
ncbi:MAG: DUF2628 domain-containing protein [Alphaproteobacteria bacterium]